MKKILFVLFAVMALTACKKEVKIEKNLWKNGGEWKIESLTSKQVSNYPADNFEGTSYNYGTYTFKKDGSGSYLFTEDGDVEMGMFTYSNTETTLTTIINNEARVFTIDWEKDQLTMTIVENFSTNVSSGTYTEILVLKKIK